MESPIKMGDRGGLPKNLHNEKHVGTMWEQCGNHVSGRLASVAEQQTVLSKNYQRPKLMNVVHPTALDIEF